MQTQMIMNFLYGELNDTEKENIRKKIYASEELKKELELQQDIDTAIQNEIRVENFMAGLNKIHDQEITKKGKVLNLHNKWYYAAASITLLTGTAVYTLKQQFPGTDTLYSQYYQKWEPITTTRGVSNDISSNKIELDFKSGKFNNVINALDENFSTQELDPKLLLLKGCAEMEIKDFNAAINTFALFESKNYTLYTEAGQWYLALCYLKNEDLETSIQILNKIVESNTSYAVEASELLNKLN